jgi:TctA family transporter
MAAGTQLVFSNEIGADSRANSKRMVFDFIADEVSTGLTFVTVAVLAFDMGQIERGNAALLRAREAHSEAEHSVEQLTGDDRVSMRDKLDRLATAIGGTRKRQGALSPALRQPSMS